MTPSHLRRPRPAAGLLASYRARSESGVAGWFFEIRNAAELADRCASTRRGTVGSTGGSGEQGAAAGRAESLARGEPEYCSWLGGGRDSEPNGSVVGKDAAAALEPADIRGARAGRALKTQYLRGRMRVPRLFQTGVTAVCGELHGGRDELRAQRLAALANARRYAL